MKRVAAALALVVVCVGWFAPHAAGWGIGTHVYVAGELIGKGGGRSLEQAYGACMPDMFNFVAALNPFMPGGVYDTLHGFTGIDLAEAWANAAGTDRDKALAFGYLSHAIPGGADWGAHVDPGYAPERAAALYGFYHSAFDANGIDEPTALFFCEVILEHAIDLMLAEANPSLGDRMKAAAASRGKGTPALFADVFGAAFTGYGGAPFLVAAEAQYRAFVMAYGEVLALDPADAQGVTAALLAMSALDMLGIPPAHPLYAAMLAQFTELTDGMLGTAKVVCADAPEVLEAVAGSTAVALDAAGVGPGSRRNR